MEKKVIRKTKNIVITGSESSGKTTLFKELKSLTGFSFLPEFSRSYINQINRPYDYNDILEIAKLYEKELEIASKNELSIISDTDLLTLLIWCEYKYDKCHSFIKESLTKNPPDFYLLCSPNIPWEFDSQRENPNNRVELFYIYLKKIMELGIDFEIIEGNSSKRLIQTKNILQNIHF
jgi:nicotinamide riboside kinase